jgi:cytochrome c oxidase cbb3-type subunit 2
VTAGPASGALRDLRGALAIAATYVYFLLFAQYGFLRLYAASVPAGPLPPVMTAMGLAGLGASAGAAVALGRRSGARLVPAAFLAAGVAALLALRAEGVAGFAAAAAVIGLAVGSLTVGLAAELDRWLRRSAATGLTVGAATGAAYVIVNWPPLFSGSPERQAVAAAIAAAVGWMACRGAAWGDDGDGRLAPPHPLRPLLSRQDCVPRGVVAVVLVFVALVGLDSAAFAIIQDTLGLQSSTWGNGTQSLRMGALHLGGALAGGMLFDRGRFFPLVVGVYGAFATGLLLLDAGSGAAVVAGALYALGIGAYSTALVLYPCARGDEPGLVARRWRAAAVFGGGGWLGSAVGVGVAERFDRIPIGLIGAAGGLLVVGLALRRLAPGVVSTTPSAGLDPAERARARAGAPAAHSRDGLPGERRGLGRTLGFAVAIGAAAWWTQAGPVAPAHPVAAIDGSAAVAAPSRARAGVERGAGAVERGRAVYVAEGCLHCHSQYVRRTGIDRELWGPWSAVQEAGDPPLYGVRRQGPDLRNVGNRRSAAWHRLHLVDPRRVSPGSRMPAYPHLFSADPRRGEDLVAYLMSLGAATASERWRAVQTMPVRLPGDGSADRGRALFAVWCSQCHGSAGRGDGPLGAELAPRERLDLTQGRLPLVSFGPGIGTHEEGVARVVRFGVAGTSMPGHEHLSWSEIADVVAALEALAASPGVR